MATSVISFPPNYDNNAAFERALSVLANHELIVAPTDTVYGIMCLYNSPEAIRRIYNVKQRPLDKALPVLIGDLSQLTLVARTPITEQADTLARSFWPGALTLILPARDDLPNELTAGSNTVGVRMPDHDALRELMRRAGPLAATSANRSGDREARTADEALQHLAGLVDIILSDDVFARRHEPAPSTVVDLTGPEPAILRTGEITEDVKQELARFKGATC